MQYMLFSPEDSSIDTSNDPFKDQVDSTDYDCSTGSALEDTIDLNNQQLHSIRAYANQNTRNGKKSVRFNQHDSILNKEEVEIQEQEKQKELLDLKTNVVEQFTNLFIDKDDSHHEISDTVPNRTPSLSPETPSYMKFQDTTVLGSPSNSTIISNNASPGKLIDSTNHVSPVRPKGRQTQIRKGFSKGRSGHVDSLKLKPPIILSNPKKRPLSGNTDKKDSANSTRAASIRKIRLVEKKLDTKDKEIEVIKYQLAQERAKSRNLEDRCKGLEEECNGLKAKAKEKPKAKRTSPDHLHTPSPLLSIDSSVTSPQEGNESIKDQKIYTQQLLLEDYKQVVLAIGEYLEGKLDQGRNAYGMQRETSFDNDVEVELTDESIVHWKKIVSVLLNQALNTYEQVVGPLITLNKYRDPEIKKKVEGYMVKGVDDLRSFKFCEYGVGDIEKVMKWIECLDELQDLGMDYVSLMEANETTESLWTS